MTDPQNAPVEQSTSPSDSPLSVTEAASAPPTDAPAIETPPSETPPSDLPDFEPLTPELVEDEAIRGDFMLRWGVILLAMLLGCRQLIETPALVHLKTGLHILTESHWPPATDPFSFTAGDRSWINLSWLFDVLLAGVHAAGGAAAISVAVGLLGATAVYWLVNTSRATLPTWWNSICAGVGLLALQADFVPLPRLVTLLGSAWLLRGLWKWTESRQPRDLWCLAGSLAVWSNLDSHAFIGWLILAAYWLGSLLAKARRREGAFEASEIKQLSLATGLGFVALAVNPFTWRAWESPFVWFGAERPALASYALRAADNDNLVWLSLFDKAAWAPPRVSVIAGLLVLVLALVTSVLNRRRVNFGLLSACVALTILGAFSQHEFAPAIAVAIVLAAINGQDWYRDRCRQEYTISTWEVLYSRGGRALTVLGFAVVAYLALSGRLMGRDGKRVGVGFSPQLAANVSGSKDDFSKLTNARLLPFRLDQGDLAIWAGQKVFVDSRVGLYLRGGDNILAVHEQARTAFRREQPRTTGSAVVSDRVSNATVRREIADRFEVSHVAARLWGVSPGYQSFWDLSATGDWTLVRLGSTAGVFARSTNVVPSATKDRPTPADKESVLSFEALAFKECFRSTPFPARTTWPRPRTGYEEFLSLKPVPVSNAVQRSRHYLQLLQGLQQRRQNVSRGEILGLAILAVREANAALVEDVNNLSAYIYLSDAYSVLGAIENQIFASSGQQPPTPQRQYQSLAAIQLASTLDPHNVAILRVLTSKYLAMQRRDLALESCRLTLDALRDQPTLTAEDIALIKQLNELRGQLEPLVERAEAFVKKATEDKTEVREITRNLQTNGFPLKALQILEADKLLLASNLDLQLEAAILLSDCGRLEDATARFDSFDEIGGRTGLSAGVWQVQAALVAMSRGDYDRAIVHCRKELQQLERTAVEGLLATSPMMMPAPPLMSAKILWPFTHVAATAQSVLAVRETTSLLRWSIINCHLESGNCEEAARELRALLKLHPESQFRPLAREYLLVLTGESQPVLPPEENVPVLFSDGTGDPEPEAPAAVKATAK